MRLKRSFSHEKYILWFYKKKVLVKCSSTMRNTTRENHFIYENKYLLLLSCQVLSNILFINIYLFCQTHHRAEPGSGSSTGQARLQQNLQLWYAQHHNPTEILFTTSTGLKNHLELNVSKHLSVFHLFFLLCLQRKRKKKVLLMKE